jgi:hypothetical protein
MESTLGAAECSLFRESVQEATLTTIQARAWNVWQIGPLRRRRYRNGGYSKPSKPRGDLVRDNKGARVIRVRVKASAASGRQRWNVANSR